MFLLLCKCIFNFFSSIDFQIINDLLDSYGYKFYAVFFFCSLSFSSNFPGVWTYVEVEWVRWRLFYFLTLLKFHWQNDNKKLSHKIQRYNNSADEVKCWTCQQRVSKAFELNVVNYSMHSFNTYICSNFFLNWNIHVRLRLRKRQGFASVSSRLFQIYLSAIYYPSGLFRVLH